MSEIRVLTWNIKDFKLSRFTMHGEAILDQLYADSSDPETRKTDIFIIIEPFSRMKKFGVGEVVTEGAGIAGILALYAALADIDPNWRIVPPRAACKPPKSDMVAVYYHKDVVTFEGPDELDYVEPDTITSGAKNLYWRESDEKMKTGKVRFYNTSNTEINFYGRRPFLTKFKAGAQSFLLMALHAPPDSRYPNNANMVKNLAVIPDITTDVTASGIPVAVCGDFNVCPIPDGCSKKHRDEEKEALTPLKKAGYEQGNEQDGESRRTGLNLHTVGARNIYATVQQSGKTAVTLDDITTHAYDHVLTFGFSKVHEVNTVNIVEADPDYKAAIEKASEKNHHPIYALCRRYLWRKGVSDHLPIKFTLTI